MFRRASARPWITVLLLLSWQAPALAAVGIGVHLSADDHAYHADPASEKRALDLALAATHGHHHELAVAPHDHSVIRVAAPSAPLPPTQVAPIEPDVAAAVSDGRAPWLESPPRTPTGTPPLFLTHRALLL